MNEEKEISNSQITPIEKDFVDENGDTSTINIQPMNSGMANIGKQNYKLASELNSKNPFKKRGLFSMDIGIRSKGFARVATLAVIISVSAIIILYFIFSI